MMSRDDLLVELQRYGERFPSEAHTSLRIERLVSDRPDCFQRDCLPGHITGSAWITTPDGNRHVLLRHKKLGKWLQPGGHADGQEDLAAVALREAIEETGLTDLRVQPSDQESLLLDVDVHRIPARVDAEGRVQQPAHEHHDLRFLLIAAGRLELTISDESHELRWCDDAEVRKLTGEPSVLRLLEKAKERLRPSLAG